MARFYADATGCTIIKNTAGDFTIMDRDKTFLRVSPDRLYWPEGVKHNAGSKAVLECKTTQMEVDADNVPVHWFCQLQMNMGVANLHQGALAWLTMGRTFGYRDFSFDAEFYGWMAEEVERFWTDCIVGGREPLPVNASDVLLKSPRHVQGKTVEATGGLLDDCRRLKELKEEMAGMESRKKELEDAVKMAMGDAEAIVEPGTARTLATWKATKDGTRFDEKKFAVDNPGLYASYLRQVQGSRRFLLR